MTDTVTPARTGDRGLAASVGLALIAALVGSVVWLVVAMLTDRSVGIVALGVGLLVGLALNRLGGRHKVLPIVAALAAILGVVVGTVLILIWSLRAQPGIDGWRGAIDYLTADLGVAWDIYRDGSKPIDFLFYALAAAAAYQVTARGLAADSAGPAEPAKPAEAAQPTADEATPAGSDS